MEEIISGPDVKRGNPVVEEKIEVPTTPEGRGIWGKLIPYTNRAFLILSIVFVFMIDLLILISSMFSLIGFWIEMLIVFGIFISFSQYEARLSKKFGNTELGLDVFIYLLVLIRNIILFLNFIPFVQIFGFFAAIFGAIPYIVIYFVLINLREKRSA